jgi:C1A family cysteine protease
MNMFNKYKYPLKLDHTEKLYTVSYGNNLTANPPSSFDLRDNEVKIGNKYLPPIYNQGKLGSCTSNALIGAFCFDDVQKYDPVDGIERFDGSRLFHYYNERKMDGDIYQDGGSTITQGIKALEKYGVCRESLWPYNDDNEQFEVTPTDEAYGNALHHRIVKTNKLNEMHSRNIEQTEKGMKNCLLAGFPFCLGIAIYESFENEDVAKEGFVPMPDTRSEEMLGGHAIMCVGYNDDEIDADGNKGCWIMRNSWGEDWGDNGYFYLPYKYLLKKSLTSDLWQIRCVTDGYDSCEETNAVDTYQPNFIMGAMYSLKEKIWG